MRTMFSVVFALFMVSIPLTAFAGEGPMKLPENAKAGAKMHNKEGIKHWGMGHFDVALDHFKEASKADGSSGEIHFNEAISYDKLGKHGVATKHFGVAKKKAAGKNKKKLLESKILNGHLGN
jgi:tetratricopeptide (TPR) repeat protein